MRKAAGLKRNSRKKERGGPTHAPPPPPPQAEQRPFRPTAGPPEMQRGKRPNPNEAALTAKNYRMAKELAELRVRLREETKKTSRMTMENMGLKSRCRESASHVAMLRQELAMHQHRAKEALALQRQQTQRMAIDLSAEASRLSLTSSSSSSSEDDAPAPLIASPATPAAADSTLPPSGSQNENKILSAITPPPPPPPPRLASSPQASDQAKSLGEPTLVAPVSVPAAEQDDENDENDYVPEPQTTDDQTRGDEHDPLLHSESDSYDISNADVDAAVELGSSQSPTTIPFDDIEEGDEDDPELNEIHCDLNAPESRDSLSPLPHSPGEKAHRLTPDKLAIDLPQLIESTPEKDNQGSDGKSTTDITEGVTLFPYSASPQPGSAPRGPGYDEEFPSDIIERPRRPHHPHPTFGHNNELSDDFSEHEEDASLTSHNTGKGSASASVSSGSSSVQTHPTVASGSTTASARSAKSMSSIDAFEASFNTAFPDSFSPKEDAAKKSEFSLASPESEIYNPFFPSPSKISVHGEVVSPPLRENKPISGSSSYESPVVTPSGKPQVSFQMHSTSPHYPRTPEEKAQWDDDQYHTPPQNVPQMRVFSSEGLKRPEKKGSMAARARYEKALQPRSASSSRQETRAEQKSKESPDSLFKRLQRRRAKLSKSQFPHDEALALTDPTAIDSSSARSARSWVPILRTEQAIEEPKHSQSDRHLQGRRESDPVVNNYGNVSPGRAGAEPCPRIYADSRNGQPQEQEQYRGRPSRRRSTKQPVSYAEPALNTKLRKGDVFFTKVAPDSVTLVTPDTSPMEPILS